MISLLVSNTSYSVMICGCWWGEFVAWSTSTSCQTSALQSFPFLLLRTNFAANSLPVAFSLHLFTTAYCPLKIKYYFPSNDRQINWPYSRDELNCQLTCRFHHKYRRSSQSVRCKEPLPFLKLFANRYSGNQALLLLVVGPQQKNTGWCRDIASNRAVTCHTHLFHKNIFRSLLAFFRVICLIDRPIKLQKY